MTSSTATRRPFLRTLGLDETADERDVRRAYARELKTIDASVDPRGFQALREAYDKALAWARARPEAGPMFGESPLPLSAPLDASRRADASDADVDVAPSSAPGREPATRQPDFRGDPYVDATAVARELVAALDGDDFDDARARSVIDRALADPRLVAVDARHLFEGLLVAGFVAGWRKNLDLLFDAAMDRFDWRADRARLRGYGNDGLMVDAAIEQHETWAAQERLRRWRQLRVLRRLRDPRLPGDRWLLKQQRLLETMQKAWPNWLRIVTSADHLGNAHERIAVIPKWRRLITYRSSDDARLPRPRRKLRWRSFGRTRWFWIWFAIILVNVLVRLAGH